MKNLSLGHQIRILCNFKINYDEDYFSDNNLECMMLLHDIIESKVELEGYINSNGEQYIKDNSPIANFLNRLSNAFSNGTLFHQVKKELLYYELYEILAEIKEPLTKEGLEIIQELPD